MRRLLLLSAVVLPACSPPLPPAGVHSGGPVTADEKRVAGWVLQAATKPDSVQWSEWGPNDDAGLTHFKDPKKWRIVRVAYYIQEPEQPRRLRDVLYIVDDDDPEPSMPDLNTAGRDWLSEDAAKKKAEEDAALKKSR